MIEIEKREIDIDEIIRIINEKTTIFYSSFHKNPKVIIVPEYVEIIMRRYVKINTSIAFNYEEYSLFMGILIIGTKSKKELKEIEVF